MIYAKYTIVLKTLLDDPETKALIDKAMSTYPLYEKRSEEKYIPSYIPTREQLNKKILDYYKYREIGFETVGRFLTELEVALNEIMPYYNQLYIDQINYHFHLLYLFYLHLHLKQDLHLLFHIPQLLYHMLNQYLDLYIWK